MDKIEFIEPSEKYLEIINNELDRLHKMFNEKPNNQQMFYDKYEKIIDSLIFTPKTIIK